jgi:hypothetical protein
MALTTSVPQTTLENCWPRFAGVWSVPVGAQYGRPGSLRWLLVAMPNSKSVANHRNDLRIGKPPYGVEQITGSIRVGRLIGEWRHWAGIAIGSLKIVNYGLDTPSANMAAG